MTNHSSTKQEAVVTVQCVSCRKKRDVRAGEISANDVPLCDTCFMPIVAVGGYIVTKKPMKAWGMG